jgi:hypothetical protein
MNMPIIALFLAVATAQPLHAAQLPKGVLLGKGISAGFDGAVRTDGLISQSDFGPKFGWTGVAHRVWNADLHLGLEGSYRHAERDGIDEQAMSDIFALTPKVSWARMFGHSLEGKPQPFLGLVIQKTWRGTHKTGASIPVEDFVGLAFSTGFKFEFVKRLNLTFKWESNFEAGNKRNSAFLAGVEWTIMDKK